MKDVTKTKVEIGEGFYEGNQSDSKLYYGSIDFDYCVIGSDLFHTPVFGVSTL